MPNMPFIDPEVQVRSERVPRLSADDVMRYGAERFSSLYSVAENYNGATDSGRWVPLFNGYHVDKETYERRKLEPFPSGTEGTLPVRPFSEHDLRYKTPQRALPAAKPEGKALTAEEIVRRIRGE
jgi:hypothetical protein